MMIAVVDKTEFPDDEDSKGRESSALTTHCLEERRRQVQVTETVPGGTMRRNWTNTWIGSGNCLVLNSDSMYVRAADSSTVVR